MSRLEQSSGMDTASSAPILNKYKQDLARKRILHTLLGGLRLRLGFSAPFYVYFNQIILWIMPMVLASVFTVMAETDNSLETVASYAYGVSMFLFLVITFFISALIRRSSAVGKGIQQHNVLAEDDEVRFTSCTDVETLDFVIQQRRSVVNLLIHSIISGTFCGLLFLYLSPIRTLKLFGNISHSVMYYILSWFIVCTAHYSVIGNKTPEPAQFKSSSFLDLDVISRLTHLGIFGIFGAFARLHSSMEFADYVFHFVFLFAPLLWLLGVLPPFSSLIPWLGDQVLVFLFGGSAMATNMRLFTMLSVSLISSAVIYGLQDFIYLPSSTTLLGLLSSLDICTCLELFTSYIITRPFVKNSYCSQTLQHCLPSNINKSLLFALKSKQTIAMVLITICLIVLNVFLVSMFEWQLSIPQKQDFRLSLALSVIVVYSIYYLIGGLQNVYIFFGSLRNPLFRKTVEGDIISKWISFCKTAIYNVNRGLSYIVLPLLLNGVFTSNYQRAAHSFFEVILIYRAFRLVWQDISHCCMDMIIVFIIQEASVAPAWWNSQFYFMQLFFVGLFRDRAGNFISKSYFILVFYGRFYFSSKQRHDSWKLILLTSCLLFPLLFALFLISVVFSCPLLPIFTLPLIFIGFPRPNRYWPDASVSSKSSALDWIYYESLTLDLHAEISKMLQFGSLPQVRNGSFYLARFQDRIIVISVLEKGLFHIGYTLKGLELQETSCHTIEAGAIDDLFESSFSSSTAKENYWLNMSLNHVLTPCDIVSLFAYSDAKSVLTGVIDQKSTLKKTHDTFINTLIWVIVRHCWRRRKENVPMLYQQNEKRTHTRSSVSTKATFIDGIEDSKVQAWAHGTSEVTIGNNSGNSSWSKESYTSQNSGQSLIQQLSTQHGHSFKHFDGKEKENTPEGSQMPEPNINLKPITHGVSQVAPRLLDDDDDFDDFGFGDEEFDIPQKISIGGNIQPTKEKGSHHFQTRDASQHDALNEMKSSGMPQVSSTVEKKETLSSISPLSSSHSKQLEPPSHWFSGCPIEKSDLNMHSNDFNEDWYSTVVSTVLLDYDAVNASKSICSDHGLLYQFKKIILSCYHIVEVAGLFGAPPGPSHVLDTFLGKIAWSHYSSWLEEDLELKELVIRAYRYAFKLAYDEHVVGEIESNEELLDNLMAFEQNWYMGPDNKDGWTQAVLEKKPFLFNIGHDRENGTFTSRTLTLQKINVPVGVLNKECVQSIWASLSLELLYFTNDDEERYSIQAHPNLLRNIIIQAADPPLGYPVYSSGLLKGWGL